MLKLVDLSGNGRTAAAVNAPTYTAGTGYSMVFGSKQRLDLPFSMADLGTAWRMEIDVTIPASLDERQYLCGDGTGLVETSALMLRLNRDGVANPGCLYVSLWNSEDTRKYVQDTTDLRGGRHVIAVAYNASGVAPETFGVFIDGVQVFATALDTGLALRDVGTELTLGGMTNSGNYYSDITWHSVRIWSNQPRIYTGTVGTRVGPYARWALGTPESVA